VDTSWGCTVLKWDKKPIELDEETEIEVEITPEEAGFFHKTVKVYGKRNDSADCKRDGKLKLRIYGDCMDVIYTWRNRVLYKAFMFVCISVTNENAKVKSLLHSGQDNRVTIIF
jgi:hypothetical protein